MVFAIYLSYLLRATNWIEKIYKMEQRKGMVTALDNLYLSKLSKSVDESTNANRQIFISFELSPLQIL